MDKEDLEYFRKLLLQKKEDLLKELNYLQETVIGTSLKESSGDLSSYSIHMADQGTDMQEREQAFLFAHREGRYVYHIDEALRRIEKGTYGICMECGRPISRERLEAVPHARLCIKCKTEEERRKAGG